MLKALYDYAQQHPDIIQRPGFERRSIPYIVDLTSSGDFIGVRAIDKENRSVVCPSAGVITSGVNAHPVADKASVALRIMDDEPSKKQEAKCELFLNRFVDNVDSVPSFQAVATALTTDEILDTIQTEFVKAGGEPGDVVGFSVDGVNLWADKSVIAWWSKVNDSIPSEPTAIDVVTGEFCQPVNLWRKIKGRLSAGGQSSGVTLVSFNANAYSSYGFDGLQGMNCPVSESTMGAIVDAIMYLGEHAGSIGDVKLVHWYAGEVERDDDLLSMLLDKPDDSEKDSVNDDVMTANAGRLARSPFDGSVPPDLSGIQYHIMVLKPVMSRMVIQRYEQGSYDELYQAIASWFDDLSLVSGKGIVPVSYPRLYSMMMGLLTDSEAKKSDKVESLQPFVMGILHACFSGGMIPDAIGYRALSGFRSGMYPDNGEDIKWGSQYRKMQWIKLWLNRKRLSDKTKGDDGMPEVSKSLDRGMTQPAYVCGRLMAIYDAIQRMAANLNSSVVSKYFTSCSQSPALVLGRLQAMSVHHMDNIRSGWYRKLFQDELAQAWSMLTGEIPARLGVVEQAYFSCGYWHEMAELNGAMHDTLENATGENNKEEI